MGGLKTKQDIPDSDHVLRYCKPSNIVDGEPSPGAFAIRPGEQSLSVNWLEFFGKETPTVRQIEKVQKAMGAKLALKRSGRFARINAGSARKKVAGLEIKHLPTPKNRSHAGIFYPGGDNEETALELANMVKPEDIFPVTHQK
ncbi:MAG: hypothetical protein OXU71_02660 [Gammaproteobacteria bacterium]|nr:hypothetical protein [Gammaproteobacteria bacterium]